MQPNKRSSSDILICEPQVNKKYLNCLYCITYAHIHTQFLPPFCAVLICINIILLNYFKIIGSSDYHCSLSIGQVLVSESHNNRIQVLIQDLTFSHSFTTIQRPPQAEGEGHYYIAVDSYSYKK